MGAANSSKKDIVNEIVNEKIDFSKGENTVDIMKINEYEKLPYSVWKRSEDGVYTKINTVDSVVNSVLEKFIQRSNVGLEKYNTTLDRTDLSTLDWLNHLQEELMDAALYVERLKQEFSKK